MNESKPSDFTMPFIPQQIIIQSGSEIQVFNAGFDIKGKSNIIPLRDPIEQHRIVNQEGILIIEDKTKTMLIQGIFTRTIPLHQCLQQYLIKYLLGHPFVDLHGEQKYIIIPNNTSMKLVQQDHLSYYSLKHTSGQFDLEIVQPLQYEIIIKTRVEHNTQQSNNETGEC